MSERIELKAKVVKKLFYSPESMFGVYSFEPKGGNREVVLSAWGNFVVNGNTPELVIGKDYEIAIEPTTHPKYGKGYSFVEVKQKRPTTVKEQQDYIRTMLSENQAESIIARYPNEKILDMMKDGTFDVNGIKGIKQKKYEKIKSHLFSHLDIQEALVELKDLEISFKAMKRLIDHFGDAGIVVQKVKENIYNLCQVKMFAFNKVDQYALKRGDSKTNQNRIIAAFDYIINEEAKKGHTWISIEGLITVSTDLLKIELEPIKTALEYIEQERTDYYFDDKRVALKKYYKYEDQISKRLIQMANNKNKLFIKDVEERILEIENKKGIKFTDEQRNAIKLATENNVFVLNGKGGVGKTFSLQGILEVLNDYSYVCCALSGKAAKIMSNHNLNAMTIHRMLKVNPDGSFSHNSENPLPYNIVVIDEASMVNSYLFYSIVIALADDAKLIILGDSGQLPSIGTACVFEDILNTGFLPQQELTIVQRQAAKSGILSVANTIRDGKQINGRYDYDRQVFGELKDLVLIPQDKENIKDYVLDICNMYKEKTSLNEFQVITALRSKGDLSVKNLNIELQKIFNDIDKPCVKRGGYEYRQKDKIIQNGNNYDVGIDGNVNVFNGTLGIIDKIQIDKEKGDKLWITFDGIEEQIIYEKEDLDNIELAYAITVHRSQGSTIRNILFVFDYSAYTLLSRQFVYTGISRAAKGCVVICENGALHHAIKTDQSGIRRTFLGEMLLKLKVC